MLNFISIVFLAVSVSAFPHLDARGNGVVITAPPMQTDTGTKPIPDAQHYYRAAGPNDQRGPCPGLNTMANHGYIPRNGIASFEQIVTGAGEAFNMDYTLASALAAFGMLARGNAFIDLISIGLPSPQVPPLPKGVDGTQAGGLATHGRFEGDVSMTRQDFTVGDNIHFNPTLFSQLLAEVALWGDNSTVTGPNSIVNTKVMQEFKFKRFLDDQIANKELEYHVGRFVLSYGEAAFTLNFFANGTTGLLDVNTMTSFFQNQTFPANWHRRAAPGTADLIGTGIATILTAHPINPGFNDANGNYVQESVTGDAACAAYQNLAGDNLPSNLNNATGILKTNVQFLITAMHNAFSGCPVATPSGPNGV